jgi:hypothetical protein
MEPHCDFKLPLTQDSNGELIAEILGREFYW